MRSFQRTRDTVKRAQISLPRWKNASFEDFGINYGEQKYTINPEELREMQSLLCSERIFYIFGWTTSRW